MIFKERNKAVPAVYLILQKDGKILLMRRKGSNYFDGWYSLPAGHVEAGELPLAALVRETKEEIDASINLEDAKLVYTMYRPKHDETGERVDLFFSVKKWAGEIKIVEQNKCDDIQWFPLDNLPKNIIPYVKDAIQNIGNKINYSEFLS